MCSGIFCATREIDRKGCFPFPVYDEPDQELLTFLGQFYEITNHFKPKEILLPESVDAEMAEGLLGVKTIHPKRGSKKDMLKLANKNAAIALQEKFSLIERDEERTINAVENLGVQLGIYTPHRIEAFDNSNIQGSDPVSALVVFIDGKPEKESIANIKSKLSRDPMTMNRCVKLYAEDIHEF